MDGSPASFHGVVGHRRAFDQGVEEPLAPVRGQPAEHRCETTSCRKPFHLGSVEGNVRRHTIARERQCRWIGTVEGNGQFPERREGTRRRRIDSLLIRWTPMRLDRLGDSAALGGAASTAIGSATVRSEWAVARTPLSRLQSTSSGWCDPVYSANSAVTPHGLGMPTARA